MTVFGLADPGQPGLGFGLIATILFAVMKVLSWLFGR